MHRLRRLRRRLCRRSDRDRRRQGEADKRDLLRTADTLFSGEILEGQQRVFGDDFKTGLPREKGATLIMRFRWKDLRTGRILVERERFVHSVEYLPPVGETFAKGMVRGLDGLAETIVETMESSW